MLPSSNTTLKPNMALERAVYDTVWNSPIPEVHIHFPTYLSLMERWPVSWVSNLRSLSVTIQGPLSAAWFVHFTAIRFIIVHSPLLSRITLSIDPSTRHEKFADFASLLTSLPQASLDRLKHLTLLGNQWTLSPHWSSIQWSHLQSLEVERPSVRLGDQFWQVLRQSGVTPRKLVVRGRLDPQLIDYLESFSGLEELVLQDNSPVIDRGLSVRFYDEVIPRHASTLIKLSIISGLTGRRNFGRHPIERLGLCQRLEYLKLMVCCTPWCIITDKSQWESEEPMVCLHIFRRHTLRVTQYYILKLAFTVLPNLKELSVYAGHSILVDTPCASLPYSLCAANTLFSHEGGRIQFHRDEVHTRWNSVVLKMDAFWTRFACRECQNICFEYR